MIRCCCHDPMSGPDTGGAAEEVVEAKEAAAVAVAEVAAAEGDDTIHELAELFHNTLHVEGNEDRNPFNDVDEETFDNQDQLGEKIAEWFSESPEHIHAFVYSPTQSGKTGAMLRACAHIYDKLKIPVSNTYVMTTLRSNEWRSQTQGRFPEIMRQNIWHLSDLQKHIVSKSLLGIRDVVIVIDEMHWGAAENGILHQFMEAHMYNNTYRDTPFTMRDFNIRMIHVTATPEDSWTMMETAWGAHARHFTMFTSGNEPSGYVSIKDLVQSGRVLQCESFVAAHPDSPEEQRMVESNVVAFLKSIGDTEPKYHIIRCPSSRGKKDADIDGLLGIDAVQAAFSKYTNLISIKQVHSDVGKDDFKQINDYLKTKPERHTLLLIKEGSRCAITLKPKDNLGVMYERYVGASSYTAQNAYRNDRDSLSPSKVKQYEARESTVVQSLIGRLTGYHNNVHSVVYTDIGYVNSYIEHTYDLHGQNSDSCYKKTTDKKYFMKMDDDHIPDFFFADDCAMMVAVVTMSAGNKPSPAQQNYNEQKERHAKGLALMWDDNKDNDAQVGDIFGFTHYKDKVEIHKIIKIGPPCDRLPTWNALMRGKQHEVAHAAKNVVYLSDCLLTIPWSFWVDELGGHKMVRGNQHVKTNLDSIRTFIQQHVQPPPDPEAAEDAQQAPQQPRVQFVEGAPPVVLNRKNQVSPPPAPAAAV